MLFSFLIPPMAELEINREAHFKSFSRVRECVCQKKQRTYDGELRPSKFKLAKLRGRKSLRS